MSGSGGPGKAQCEHMSSALPRWHPENGHCSMQSAFPFRAQERTHAPPQKQTSGRVLLAVIFGCFSVECPLYKIDGINCRPKLGAKLLNRFFHRRREVSPPVNNVTHRCRAARRSSVRPCSLAERRTFRTPSHSPCGLSAPAVATSNRLQNRCPLL